MKCPFCAEEIQDEAVICRFCGRNVEPKIRAGALLPEKKKSESNVNRIVAAIVVIIMLFGLYSCLTNSPENRNSSTNYTPLVGYYIVKYEISGSAYTVSITRENDGGNTEQEEARLPYQKTYYDFKYGDFLYISAQNNGKNGDLTCRIYVDEELVEEAKSSGSYSIASCSHRIGE